MKYSIILLALAALAATEQQYYHGAQVLKVVPQFDDELEALAELHSIGQYDFWKESRKIGDAVEIMALKEQVYSLKQDLASKNLKYEVIVHDVEKVLKRGTPKAGPFDWNDFHTFDELEDWLLGLVAAYPNLVTLTNEGNSVQGRPLYMVKVQKGTTDKPTIFVDGGIHAREWISHATVTYMLNELLTNNAAYDDVLDAVDFYFMPQINPDGYQHSYDVDRLWRKNRKDNGACFGVDLNRNFPFQFGGLGTSSNACSDTYRGETGGSEPESQILMNSVNGVLSNLKVYLTFHSYGQYWMYPWGYDYYADIQQPANEQDMYNLGISATAALQAVFGTVYETGNSAALLYPAAGASDDWAKSLGIDYSYTVELRPNGVAGGGFQIDPSQIIPTGSETFAAFQVVFNFVRDNY